MYEVDFQDFMPALEIYEVSLEQQGDLSTADPPYRSRREAESWALIMVFLPEKIQL